MTHHARLNLIMLVTMIGALVFLYFKPYAQQAQEYSIAAPSSDAVQNVRIVKQHDEILLSKTSGRWRLLKPIQARIDEKRITEILQIQKAKAQQRFPLENLDRFGLDRPYVQLYIDDEYFGFGSYAPITNQQYVANDEYVYVISPRYGLAFPAHATDLVSKRLLDADEIPIRFEGDSFIVELQKQQWQIKNPQSSDLLSDKKLNEWVKSWQTAQAEKILLPHEVPADASEMAHVNISLRDGDPITINILHHADQMIVIRSHESVGYSFSENTGKRLLNPLH